MQGNDTGYLQDDSHSKTCYVFVMPLVQPTDKHAFSLVELSIVLVILGLLTGGILAGQSLIRAAELNSIPNEYNKYLSATNAFRDKYFALPGDMGNATLFWGRNGCGASQTTGTTSANGTCNGNGNGRLNLSASAGWYTMSREENSYFWQHLALAGLIENNTVPFPFASGPRAKPSNMAWRAAFTGEPYSIIGLGASNAGLYGRQLWGFELLAISGYYISTMDRNGSMKAEDAWSIDTKIDDGNPGRGRVLTINLGYYDWGAGSPNRCVNSNPFSTPTIYQLTDTTISCDVVFVADYK